MVPVAPRSSSIGQRDECSLLRFLATRARRLQDDGVLSGECFRALKRSLGQLRLASMLQALRRRRSPFYHMLIRAHLRPLPVLVHGETPSTNQRQPSRQHHRYLSSVRHQPPCVSLSADGAASGPCPAAASLRGAAPGLGAAGRPLGSGRTSGLKRNQGRGCSFCDLSFLKRNQKAKVAFVEGFFKAKTKTCWLRCPFRAEEPCEDPDGFATEVREILSLGLCVCSRSLPVSVVPFREKMFKVVFGNYQASTMILAMRLGSSGPRRASSSARMQRSRRSSASRLWTAPASTRSSKTRSAYVRTSSQWSMFEQDLFLRGT